MDDSDAKETINLKDIRRQQGLNFHDGGARQPAASSADGMYQQMQLDLDGESDEPPLQPVLTETERKSKELLAVLEKVSAAERHLVEAQATLTSLNFDQPALTISHIINGQIRNLENQLQRQIIELCDGGGHNAPDEAGRNAIIQDMEAAAEFELDISGANVAMESNENVAPVVFPVRQQAECSIVPQSHMDADAALAYALQNAEQEQNDLRLAHALQEREERELQHAQMRDMQRQASRERRRRERLPRRSREMHRRMEDTIAALNQHRMQMQYPNFNFSDSDSDSDGMNVISMRNLVRELHRMPRGAAGHPNAFIGDMDDLIRNLEMQDRGANREEINQFSNEEQFQARKESGPSNNGDNSEQCCICMENFVEGDKIRRLPCLHIFHTNEIDQWLQQNRTCPICKTDIQSATNEIR